MLITHNNIPHKQQYFYENLIGLGGGVLKFDFAVLDNDDKPLFQIEYQGEQHYKSVKYFGGDKDFAIRVYHDALKQSYCEDNDIPLLIIPYWEYDNIEKILEEKLKLKQINMK